MEESDDSIRRAILSGEKDAYKGLVARYSQVVFRVAYRITGNEPDAEEAVQEAFLRGYQKLTHFEGRSSMATWFYRIGANCAPVHGWDSRRANTMRARSWSPSSGAWGASSTRTSAPWSKRSVQRPRMAQPC